jgi:hypothetical protein
MLRRVLRGKPKEGTTHDPNKLKRDFWSTGSAREAARRSGISLYLAKKELEPEIARYEKFEKPWI